MNPGKQKCEILRRIRMDIAEKYGLRYNPTVCTHEGGCSGTCPKCDAEAEDLQKQLDSRGITDIVLSEMRFETIEESEDWFKLEGDVTPPSGDELITVTMGLPAPPLVSRRKKRVLYKECQIAGITFHDLKDVWDELYEGAELALVRQKDNKHDKYAIAVALADDYDGDPDDFDFDFILGYVPRTENRHLATMMDLGWAEAFDCELSQINGSNPYKGSLYMKIYMVSKDEEEIEETEHLLPVLEFDDEQIELFKSSLKQKGFSCQRWGALLPDTLNLPDEGDKVVILHRNETDAELYLTHIIAKDKNAEFFVKNEERVIDDCFWFILTNVVGPVLVSNDEIKFLNNEPINKVRPEEYISQEATEKLYRLIYTSI
ncbi:MAG: HIRAN domain-containing protein [Bacteroidaceae bacterium]|nr:HIRAN domain-containing protein [Bacteroidaceae bacterium]